MRVYRADGTYKDNPNDTGFGWYLSELTREPSNEEMQNLDPPDLVSMTFHYHQALIDNMFRQYPTKFYHK